jgi:hypothetical protein
VSSTVFSSSGTESSTEYPIYPSVRLSIETQIDDAAHNVAQLVTSDSTVMVRGFLESQGDGVYDDESQSHVLDF